MSNESQSVVWCNHLILCHPISFLHILLFSCSVMSDSLQPHGLQHTRLACPSPSPGACSNSCPLSQWCHPAISSSVIPFSCLQTSPASGSFLMSQLFTSGSQSIGASPSILSMNIQGWFPLGWTGLISLQSKGFSRVFSNTTVQKDQKFKNAKLNFDCTLQFPKGLCEYPNVQVTSWSYCQNLWGRTQLSIFLKLSSSFNVKPRLKINYLLSLFKMWLEGQPARLAHLTMILLDMRIFITFSRLPKWL